MKIPSRRNLLIAGVALVICAHFLIRWLDAPAKPKGPAPGSDEAVAAANQEITPSVSSLAYMGYEWQQHIKALPPEERAASQARFDQEKAFFVNAMKLPEAERDKAVKEHLQELMNDPHLQAVMAEDRFKKLSKLPPETRRKLLKSYVDYKSSVTGK
jgi:hypothetical protein